MVRFKNTIASRNLTIINNKLNYSDLSCGCEGNLKIRGNHRKQEHDEITVLCMKAFMSLLTETTQHL